MSSLTDAQRAQTERSVTERAYENPDVRQRDLRANVALRLAADPRASVAALAVEELAKRSIANRSAFARVERA